MKPYIYYRFILVIYHLIQLIILDVFISTHLFVLRGSFWGPKQCFFFLSTTKLYTKLEFEGIMCSSQKDISNILSHT
jgi:hypothetical protein